MNRVINEAALDREAELGQDIVAGFEIVTDSRVKDRFAVDRLITESGAPWLKKVYADGSAKDGTLVRTIKILK
jgi:hypothetical protein